MYFQSQPGYLSMQDFDAGAFHHAKKPLTLEHVQSVLRRISGTAVSITALRLATTWTDRARQATAYRSERILLAGDAAHIHSPLGGQGLNLGLGDAMNLGWKLAATVRGNAPDGLLESYHAERHPIGAEVLNWSRAQVALMRPDPHAQALHAIVRDLIETRDGATYFAARVWGVLTRYDLGNDHPLVGRSVPNFEFTDGSMLGERMRDGRGVLLDLQATPSLEALAGGFVDGLSFLSLPAKDRLGLTALLIRPDGIVAWASDGEPDEGHVENAVRRWFPAHPHDGRLPSRPRTAG